jgi:hypothetical protein
MHVYTSRPAADTFWHVWVLVSVSVSSVPVSTSLAVKAAGSADRVVDGYASVSFSKYPKE